MSAQGTVSAQLADIIRSAPGRPRPGVCTVALSGGADSVALLLLMKDLAEELGLTVRAVHIHHGIRGEEADRDAEFCEKLCRAREIPFETVHINVPEYAASHRLSTETAARQLRRRALEEAAPEGDIVTAHHADDNAETVLFHLMRGSGTRGLAGIPPRSGRYAHPLLQIEKRQLTDFLIERGQPFMIDSTNKLPDATRNRIRHGILPMMAMENSALLRHISQAAQALLEDDALLTKQARTFRSRHTDPETGGISDLQNAPRPVRMRVYISLLEHLPGYFTVRRIDPAYALLQRIDTLVRSGRGRQLLSGRIFAEVSGGALYLTEEPEPVELPLEEGENRVIPGKTCSARLSRNFHTDNTGSALDSDKIRSPLYFRPVRRSDRIRLPGRHETELRKLIQAAYPPPLRRRLHALFDEAGCVWCEGIGTAERVMPDEATENCLILQVRGK